MKMILRVSILLNLLLLGGLCFVALSRSKKETASVPVPLEIKPMAQPVADPVPPASSVPPPPFRWSQLESGNDYGVFIANLRAAGCPESTIEDIVSGNVGRAFAWKRAQLKLDDSGVGSWSRVSETALVDHLLGKSSSSVAVASSPAAQNNAGDAAQPASSPAYPLFLADANWSKLGFDANEQVAIASARQQFLSEVNGPSPNANDPSSANNNTASPDPNDPAFLQRWQTALKNANDSLSASLGGQDFATYEMEEYYEWFKPQVLANTGGGNLNVNLPAYVPQ